MRVNLTIQGKVISEFMRDSVGDNTFDPKLTLDEDGVTVIINDEIGQEVAAYLNTHLHNRNINDSADLAMSVWDEGVLYTDDIDMDEYAELSVYHDGGVLLKGNIVTEAVATLSSHLSDISGAVDNAIIDTVKFLPNSNNGVFLVRVDYANCPTNWGAK